MRRVVAVWLGAAIFLSSSPATARISASTQPTLGAPAQNAAPDRGPGHQLVRGVPHGRGRGVRPGRPVAVGGHDAPQPPALADNPNKKHVARYLSTTTTNTAVSAPELPSAPILGESFQGFSGGGVPDPIIAVGRHNVVIATNQGYGAFDKLGNLLPNTVTQPCAGSCDLFTFFTNASSGAGIFDPWLLYDGYLDRYWFIAVTRSETPRNSDVLIALSNSNDVADGWTLFAVNARRNGDDPVDQWCDYPKIGIDTEAIYLTCNMFSFPLSESTFQYAKIRVMTKTQFVEDTCCYWFDWWNLVELSDALQVDHSYTIQPAHMYLANADDGMYLVNATNSCVICPPHRLWLRHITNPTVCCVPGHQQEPNKLESFVEVGGMEDPPNAEQPGGATSIYTQDNRLLNAVWIDGHLSTTQNIKCDSENSSCVAFTELDVSHYPGVSIVTDMIIPADGSDRYFPSVDTRPDGKKTIVYTRSSSTEYASAVYVGVPSHFDCTDCLDGPETVLQAGGNTFVSLDSRNHNRWGDFMGSAADPDGFGIWIYAEYASATQDTWGTIVGLTYEQPDTTPPVTSIDLIPVPSGSGWNKADVHVTLNTTDQGGGVWRLTYSASGAQTVPQTVVDGGHASFTITAEGETTVTFFAEDNWGNFETTKTKVVRIDKVAPVATCGTADAVWHATDAIIACTATDDRSGLVNPADAGFTLSTNVPAETETSNACTVSRTVFDRAGNATTAGPVCGNKVDKKAPTISINTPAADAVYVVNQSVAASYSCSDAGSGVATCVGSAANGAPIDTSSVGTKTFTVVATDKVGNTRSLSRTYVVTYKICLLYDPNSPLSGNAVPLRVALCDANGVNVSSAAVTLHATVVNPGDISPKSTVNPTNDFSYYAGLGGYLYVLNATGYAAGKYELLFTATGDPVIHAAPFRLR